MIIGKRGVSSILTIVFIILGTMIGAALLWTFVVRSTTKSGNEVVDPDCFTINLDVISCEAYGLCSYNLGSAGYQANILISRNVGQGNVTGIRFIFEDPYGTKRSYDRVLNGSRLSLNELETAQFVEPYDSIPVPAGDPRYVRIAALIGKNKDVCPIVSRPKNCDILNTPPPFGNVSNPNPTNPYYNDPRSGNCCLYPVNYSVCYNGLDPRYPIDPVTKRLISGLPPGNRTVCCALDPNTGTGGQVVA